jgi:sterol desaturase/sphingolipid hydroxylase (fatty acid hydroxylase superfamily)
MSCVIARMRSAGVALDQKARSIWSASSKERTTPPVQVARRRAARSSAEDITYPVARATGARMPRGCRLERREAGGAVCSIVLDPIALAVPFFFVGMAIEGYVAKKRGAHVYRFADSVTDLSCGVASQLEALFSAGTQLAIYAWVYERAHVVSLSRVDAWVVAFFGVDFAYYWWHRLSHEKNVLWAAHVVHHQSEDYNLAVALRQSIATSWTSLPFYLPLALLGVPMPVYAIVHSFSTLYQFWIHTELVPPIGGLLDRVLNLPHHHRVHHAINPQYLDKNYGATLIVWDRLFGTYAPEEEPCVYGITKPLASYSPLRAQLHYWVWLVGQTFALQGLDKLRVWVASPAWRPEGEPTAMPAFAPDREKYDVQVSGGARAYVLVQFVVLLVATAVLLLAKASLSRETLLLATAGIGGGTVALGGILESRRWAPPLEAARLVAFVGAIVLALSGRIAA